MQLSHFSTHGKAIQSEDKLHNMRYREYHGFEPWPFIKNNQWKSYIPKHWFYRTNYKSRQSLKSVAQWKNIWNSVCWFESLCVSEYNCANIIGTTAYTADWLHSIHMRKFNFWWIFCATNFSRHQNWCSVPNVPFCSDYAQTAAWKFGGAEYSLAKSNKFLHSISWPCSIMLTKMRMELRY